ncbi:MAG: DUF6261 family protein [Mediterranea sp.]|jgi:hypothetical protein|nr:DUF6261 family protein [Mediterranea sp.]
MIKKIIRLFRFHDLGLSEYFELASLILGTVLPPALAQTLGIGKAYGDTKPHFDKLVEIFRRNPTMLQTEELVETVAKIRRKMLMIRNTFKGMLGEAEGEQLKKVKILENVAHPYLKSAAHDTQSALAANGSEMADALRTTTNLPLLTQLGLKDIVNEISTLSHAAGAVLLARGEEEQYRKELGNATDTRKKLDKQLRYMLYTSIPAHYTEATGALVTTFEHVISDINGALNSFQHLTSGGSSSDHSDEEEEDDEPGNNPSKPDTQPAEPPSGGGFTDPDA